MRSIITVHCNGLQGRLAYWIALSCVVCALAERLTGVAVYGAEQRETRADKVTATNGWRDSASTKVPRESSSLVMLNDGRVLVISGHRLQPFTTKRDTAEIYDPDQDS